MTRDELEAAAAEKYPGCCSCDVGHENAIARAAYTQGRLDQAEADARIAEAVAVEYYPEDLWPEPSARHLRALHEFARGIGLPDGSRFHVKGIRHGVTLAAAAIREGVE